jgi:hypothetical protein
MVLLPRVPLVVAAEVSRLVDVALFVVVLVVPEEVRIWLLARLGLHLALPLLHLLHLRVFLPLLHLLQASMSQHEPCTRHSSWNASHDLYRLCTTSDPNWTRTTMPA